MTESKPDERETQDQVESEQGQACRIEPGTSPLALFLWLLAFHVLLACVTLTYFQPDETWQSLEIAHRHQIGYGYETWEWRDQRTGPAQTWSELVRAACMQGKGKEVLSELAKGPLRSKLFPLQFGSVYSLLRMLDLDGNFWALTLFPRIYQAGLSTVTAWSTFWLARFISRENVAWASLFSLLVSPYYLYTACRAFSNNSEAALSTLALMAFAQPRSGFDPNLVMSVAFAAYACLIRPTNALLWVFVYGQAIVRGTLLSVKRPSALLNLAAFVSLLALIGCLSLAFLAVIDSCWAGRPSLSVVPFVTQNILESIATFYGANPWHWYLTQGLPVTCMAALPFVVIGAWRMARNGSHSERLHVGSLLWAIAGLSLLSHKEWRFLQPFLPLMHICAGKALASDGPKQQQQQLPGKDHHNTALTKIWSSISSTKRVLLLAPFPLTVYLLLFHGVAQSWTLPLYTRQEYAAGRLHSLGLLMPCHSTPWQSHFHLKELGGNANKDSRLWFLTCEPPRLSDDRATYQDESDFFYDDPARFLRTAFPAAVDTSFPASRWWDRERDPGLFQGGSDRSEASPQSSPHEWPSHLALFEALLQHPSYGKAVADLLHSKGYRVDRTMFNSLFHDDPRRRGRIVVMRYSEDI